MSLIQKLGNETSTSQRSLLRKVTDVYFKPKFFEKRLYEALGVKYVQKLVNGTVGKLARKYRKFLWYEGPDIYFIGTRRTLDALKTFENGTRFNEAFHVPLTALSCYGLADCLGQGDYTNAIGWSAALLFNGALAMLQRYNRARVQKVIERKRRKTLHR